MPLSKTDFSFSGEHAFFVRAVSGDMHSLTPHVHFDANGAPSSSSSERNIVLFLSLGVLGALIITVAAYSQGVIAPKGLDSFNTPKAKSLLGSASSSLSGLKDKMKKTHRYGADLTGDLGLNQAVIISGTFVSSGSSLTLEGYETSVQALSEDSIMKKGQSMNERGSLGAIFFGLIIFIFARVKMRSAAKKKPAMAPAMSPVAAPLPPQPVAAQAAAQLQPAPAAAPFVIGCPRCSVGIQVNDPQRPLKINCPNCQTGLVVN